MAKSARSTSNKVNNQKLKSRVFGPVESARTERLSAKLLELVSQPRPPREEKEDARMELDDVLTANPNSAKEGKESEEMSLDGMASKNSSKTKSGKNRIGKKRYSAKASIVFPKYKNGKRVVPTKFKR